MSVMSRVETYNVMSRLPHPPSALPYEIYALGRISNNPHHVTLGTYHDDAMLTLFLSGRGRYSFPGGAVEVGRGVVGLVLPGPDVGMLTADPPDPYDHFFCRFGGTEAMKVAGRVHREHAAGAPFFRWQRWQEGAELFRLMTSVPNPLGSRLRPSEGILAQLLAMLDSQFTPIRQPLTEGYLRQYLQEHLSAPPGLDAMAEHFSVSKCHLCRRGRQMLGDTVHSVWSSMKLDWAKLLLADPSITISQVAERVGYPDPFYFSRVFRAGTGLSPSRWRAQFASGKRQADASGRAPGMAGARPSGEADALPAQGSHA